MQAIAIVAGVAPPVPTSSGYKLGKHFADAELASRTEAAEKALQAHQLSQALAERKAATRALEMAGEQARADVELLAQAAQQNRTREVIRERIVHLKAPDCVRLPAEFGELRNAGIPPVLRIPAQRPGVVPPAPAGRAAAAGR